VNLEVKAETVKAALATAAAMEPVLAGLEPAIRASVLVSSFFHPAVAQLKLQLPWLRVATLHGGRQVKRPNIVAVAATCQAEAVHPGTNLVSAELVRRAHDRGLKVNVWTANRWSTLRTLISLGVDGVFSDYPERVVIARMLHGQVSEPPDQAVDDPGGE
jgi:glycerophosphoryl diester phosphodiesterase